MKTMKAVIYEAYGNADVLKSVELEKPQPGQNEILVKIHATTVTSGDVRMRGLQFPLLARFIVRLVFGFFKPKKQILGHELSGVVEALGSGVSKYKIDDGIVATPTGLKSGSYAEYICIPEERKKGVLAAKPENISHNEAAALPVGAMTALFLLEQATISEGSKVLIYGASGSVGSYAIQLAKAKNATVTAVCSASNFDMVSGLGADYCIDYKTEDVSALGKTYDVIFDAVGKISKGRVKGILAPEADFLTVSSMTSPGQKHLESVLEMASKGELKAPIDKVFPLSEIVQAHEYVEAGHKKGNVVIEVCKD